MIRELLTYVPLAVWCNTVAGPPFDPVLLWYAGRHPFPSAWAFIVVGSVCAGLGAAIEAGLLRAGSARRGSQPAPPRRFYVMAFLVAASPLPFTLVRAAAIRHRPRAWPYAAAVAAGRIPRYAALIALWAVLSPPDWIVPVGFVLSAGMLACAALRRLRWPRASVDASRPADCAPS